ncbi:MAG TPA: hypothetical protein IGS52_19395 [Oscillatoriaceae cyanobacterium M33_DOE_052]|uniref:Uncharacterized protein n=1 Tax=Planktothricoides sp. SpSt-374 TaxID=2282167 RepID=A0A7C3VL50_9CYAN|nr:hypothetical protein [Oscillatoriaceae cyanobacterium M33_DOE_052]
MSNSVEFTAKIKQGLIEIPEEYQQELNPEEEITVILIKHQKRISQTGIIAELTDNPISVPGWRNKLTRDDIYQL